MSKKVDEHGDEKCLRCGSMAWTSKWTTNETDHGCNVCQRERDDECEAHAAACVHVVGPVVCGPKASLRELVEAAGDVETWLDNYPASDLDCEDFRNTLERLQQALSNFTLPTEAEHE